MVIPKEIRRTMRIREGDPSQMTLAQWQRFSFAMLDLEVRDPVEIFIEGDAIVLRKYDAACLFCGATHELLSYRGKQICRSCLRRLREETNE